MDFTGDVETLRDVEQSVRAFCPVTRPLVRIRAMLLQAQLEGTVAEISERLRVLRTGAAQLRGSAPFKRLLHLVLLLGNYVNHGELDVEHTRGFNLESLLKLSDLRSPANPEVTFLHYFVSQLMERAPELLALPEELDGLAPASKVALDTLREDVAALRVEERCLGNEVEHQRAQYDPEAFARLQAVWDDAKRGLEQVQADSQGCFQQLTELQQFFDADTKAAATDMFKLLETFLAGFARAVADVRAKPELFQPEAHADFAKQTEVMTKSISEGRVRALTMAP